MSPSIADPENRVGKQIGGTPHHALCFFVLAFALTFALNQLPPFTVAGVDLKSIVCGFGPLLSGIVCYKFFRTPNTHRISVGGVKPALTYSLVALAVLLPLLHPTKMAKSALLVVLVSEMVYSFGEEFGWRHYLQNVTAPLKKGAAALLTGTIWFFWHYSFLPDPIHVLTGQSIPALVGIPLCILLLSLLSLMFGDLVVKTKSILLPTIGHAVTKCGDPLTMGVVFLLLIGLQVLWNRFDKAVPASV